MKLYFGCRYSVGSLDREIRIWQLGRSNGNAVPTLTSNDLDLLLWPWHTLR